MSRPRNFEETAALEQAMRVFWRHGYDSTTYKMLEEATGVGARSLVNTFGDKEQLFVRILGVYRANAEGLIAKLFDPPSLDAAAALFGALGRPTDDPDDIANCGCLMVNSVFELGRTSDRVRAEVDAYRDMWRDAFRAAISAEGVPDVEARAEFLLGTLWGALSQIRLAGATTAAAPMASVVAQTISQWRRSEN